MKTKIITIIYWLCFCLSCFAETGIASHYSTKTGAETASGERLNNNAYTAAHKTLDMGTKVKVVNLQNGKEVIVRINDRGPFIEGRIIDVSQAAAKALGFFDKGRDVGLIKVKIYVL